MAIVADFRRFRSAITPTGPLHARRRGGGCCAGVVGGAVVWLGVAMIGSGTPLLACPFCTAIPNTFTDDMREATVAVLARCLSADKVVAGDELPAYLMRVEEVLKGPPDAQVEEGFRVFSFDPMVPGSMCLVIAYGELPYQWTTPTPLTPAAVAYLRGLRSLPEQGPERLGHFLPFLESPEQLIADDAYNEFARSSLAGVTAIRASLGRDRVLDRLRASQTPAHLRRLYWTFLALCGEPEDAAVFDELVIRAREDPTFDLGLDAAIACYLTLGGESALAGIEAGYLADPQADYAATQSAIMAVRVHGEEMERFPRARLAASLRTVLDRPDLADLVIPDLARWEDWSVVDRLVKLFLEAGDAGYFVKVPVANYLQMCPLPAAKEALAALKQVDPEAIRHAEVFLPFQGASAAPVPPPDEMAEAAPVEDEQHAATSSPPLRTPATPERSGDEAMTNRGGESSVGAVAAAAVVLFVLLSAALRGRRKRVP